ncbi:ABC transporter [Aureococcus anophagefferens]|uniref:ABC transporter n=1 Tax=Aureococcus anophagefferens TaxID=44056 RepID=A0ABR1FJ06_AURAN
MAKAFSAVKSDADDAALKSDDDDIAPFDAAGWLSRLTFRFALPLFRVGFERPLVEGDLPRLAERDRLPRQARRIGDAWARGARARRRACSRALASAFRRDLVVSGLLFLVDFGAVVTQAAFARFDNLGPFIHCLWASPVLLAYCLALLADVVGWAAAAAGCGVLVASVGLQAKLGFVFKRLRARTAARTDARVRTISEALTGILAVKAFAWEGSFLERVLAVRKGGGVHPLGAALPRGDVGPLLLHARRARRRGSSPATRRARVRGDGDGEGGGDAVVEAVEAAAVAVAVDAPAVAEAVDAAAVDAEDRETGGVAFGTWLAYARRAGALSVVAVLLLFVVGQALLVYSDYYLLEWANGDDQRRAKPMVTYGCIAAATVVVALLRAVAFFCRTIIASNRLHEDAVRGVLRSPLYWHHAVPRGRVLNRLSADVGNVDELLAQALFDLAQLGLMMGARPGAVDLAIFVAACVAVPPLTSVTLPLAYAFLRHKRFVGRSMTELKRLEALTKSPAVSRFADTIAGLAELRAFGREAHARRRLLAACDANARAWYGWLLSQRYLGFWLDFMCVAFLACLVALAALLRADYPRPLLALGLLYAVQLAGSFQWTVRQYALAESFMSSCERLLHYDALPGEDERSADAALAAWAPASGTITLEDVRCRYRPGSPDVVLGVSATLASGSNVGIVGRTGSGKSSLLLSLNRLNLVSGGAVRIDGVDASTLPLAALRRAVALIPQEPFLFQGTRRYNLDPFGLRDDATLAGTLATLGMGGAGLDDRVLENGDNLSAGERQLTCVARALLLDRKVICLDEATASVDADSDAAIQRALRAAPAFRAATLIVVAHRIGTIIDSDTILVLDAGRLVEAGSPAELLADDASHFAGLVKASGLGKSRSSSNLPGDTSS